MFDLTQSFDAHAAYIFHDPSNKKEVTPARIRKPVGKINNGVN
jgi:hypothetical protein